MISLLQLGTIDYATGLRLQQQLVALRKEEKIGDVLLLLQHAPVITLGRNAKAANVVASPELLKRRDVELFECDRGGDVTFHGPGQIVGYPIFDLRGLRSNDLSSRAEENDSKNRSLESRDLVSQREKRNREGHDFSRADREPNIEAALAAGVTTRKHLGAVDFVRSLEDVLMRTCADFAIPTKRIPGLTGVWTDPQQLSSRADITDLSSRADTTDLSSRADITDLSSRADTTDLSSRAEENDSKNRSLESRDPLFAEATGAPEAKLAAIGVHISRFITSHGFALNVNTDLSYFNLIVPCGITTKPVTSMQKELARELDLNTVAESISRNFGTVFQSQILWLDTLDALLGRTVGVPMKPPAELRQLRKEDDSTWA